MVNVSGLTILYKNSSGPYLPKRKGDGQSIFQSWSMPTTACHIPQPAASLSCCSLGENQTFLLIFCWSHDWLAAHLKITSCTLGRKQESISNMRPNSRKLTMTRS